MKKMLVIIMSSLSIVALEPLLKKRRVESKEQAAQQEEKKEAAAVSLTDEQRSALVKFEIVHEKALVNLRKARDKWVEDIGRPLKAKDLDALRNLLMQDFATIPAYKQLDKIVQNALIHKYVEGARKTQSMRALVYKLPTDIHEKVIQPYLGHSVIARAVTAENTLLAPNGRVLMITVGRNVEIWLRKTDAQWHHVQTVPNVEPVGHISHNGSVVVLQHLDTGSSEIWMRIGNQWQRVKEFQIQHDEVFMNVDGTSMLVQTRNSVYMFDRQDNVWKRSFKIAGESTLIDADNQLSVFGISYEGHVDIYSRSVDFETVQKTRIATNPADRVSVEIARNGTTALLFFDTAHRVDVYNVIANKWQRTAQLPAQREVAISEDGSVLAVGAAASTAIWVRVGNAWQLKTTVAGYAQGIVIKENVIIFQHQNAVEVWVRGGDRWLLNTTFEGHAQDIKASADGSTIVVQYNNRIMIAKRIAARWKVVNEARGAAIQTLMSSDGNVVLVQYNNRIESFLFKHELNLEQELLMRDIQAVKDMNPQQFISLFGRDLKTFMSLPLEQRAVLQKKYAEFIVPYLSKSERKELKAIAQDRVAEWLLRHLADLEKAYALGWETPEKIKEEKEKARAHRVPFIDWLWAEGVFENDQEQPRSAGAAGLGL